MSVKISRLEIENVKRVKAVTLEPKSEGLTIIGGNNDQGKTSVLDAITWALGGEKYRPSDPARDGSVVPPSLHVKLSNGLVVERKGKNSSLTVTDPNGGRSGQRLLDSFVEQLALDLPKFMAANNKEKARILLEIIGVGEQLEQFDRREQELYNKRHAIGQIADQKAKFAEELAYYPEAPEAPLSLVELGEAQQQIIATNNANARMRSDLKNLEAQSGLERREIDDVNKQITELQYRLQKLKDKHAETDSSIETLMVTVGELVDQETDEIEEQIHMVEQINAKVRANNDKDLAKEDAAEYREQYEELTIQIEGVRKARLQLLEGADLPLAELGIEDAELTYKGKKWDGMSSSDQLIVATAIVKKLKPDCGFVLIDEMEKFDVKKLEAFGKWLESEGLQAIATRVSTGEECQIIIEDGYAREPEKPKFKAGAY